MKRRAAAGKARMPNRTVKSETGAACCVMAIVSDAHLKHGRLEIHSLLLA
jgi:hypothetical protein